MSIVPRGRPKGKPRVKISLYLTKETRGKIDSEVDARNDKKSSRGKVVESKFESQMIKFACDECQKPIQPSEDHIMLGNVALIKSGKIAQLQQVHLCDKGCLVSFFTKALNRPVLVTTINGN